MPRIGRSQPFAPIIKRGALSAVYQAAGSAQAVVSASATSGVLFAPVTASASAVVSATAGATITTAELTASAQAVVSAAAGETITTVELTASAQVVVSALATEYITTAELTASAEAIVSAAASQTRLASASAGAEAILTATALGSQTGVTTSSAQAILTATAVGSQTGVTFSTAKAIVSAEAAEATAFGGLRHSAQAIAVLSATATEGVAYSKSATASVAVAILSVAAGGVVTAHTHSFATAVLRARARRAGRLSFAGGSAYLGRFQAGQEVPLWVQCFGPAGPLPPPEAPRLRLYRDGVLVGSCPIAALAGSPGRFGGALLLGQAQPPGRYLAVVSYDSGGVLRSQAGVFEVVAGGDAGAPVLALHSVERPDGDQLLAHLGAGLLVVGRGPYLDEGV